jgi:hypothetical protein
MFKDGWKNIFTIKSEVVGHLEWMMILLRVKDGISELSCELPQISRTVLYKIITVRPGYHKF